MTNKRIIVGIDPDVHKVGIAVYDRDQKFLTIVTSEYIWEIFKMLLELKEQHPDNLFVRLEDGRMINCSSFHAGGKGSSLQVGKNQGVCIILDEFLQAHEFDYELIKPAGYSNMFKERSMFERTTGWVGMTNSDGRSGAAMVWNY